MLKPKDLLYFLLILLSVLLSLLAINIYTVSILRVYYE